MSSLDAMLKKPGAMVECDDDPEALSMGILPEMLQGMAGAAAGV